MQFDSVKNNSSNNRSRNFLKNWSFYNFSIKIKIIIIILENINIFYYEDLLDIKFSGCNFIVCVKNNRSRNFLKFLQFFFDKDKNNYY